MRPEHVVSTIKTLIAINRTVMLEGSPGLGKTQVVQQACREEGIDLLHFHAPTLLPENIAIGAPNAERTTYKFLINSRFPIEGSSYDPDSRGVILIDEIPQADNSIQKIMANLVQEREIHGHKLLPGWSVIMTGNRATDKAGANRILSHLGNRMTRLDFEPSTDDWIKWAIDHDIKPEVISFIRFRSGLLNDFKPERDINPTPRAWAEGVSAIIGVVPEYAELACFTGAVGEGAAAEFKAFVGICRSLPTIESVLANPEGVPVPTENNVRFALCGALAHASTPENFDTVMTFVNRMPTEYGVITTMDAMRRNGKTPEQTRAFTSTKAFIKWATGPGKDALM